MPLLKMALIPFYTSTVVAVAVAAAAAAEAEAAAAAAAAAAAVAVAVAVAVVVVVLVVLGFRTLLSSQVISVAFYSEREKSGKSCSEALISS